MNKIQFEQTISKMTILRCNIALIERKIKPSTRKFINLFNLKSITYTKITEFLKLYINVNNPCKKVPKLNETHVTMKKNQHKAVKDSCWGESLLNFLMNQAINVNISPPHSWGGVIASKFNIAPDLESNWCLLRVHAPSRRLRHLKPLNLQDRDCVNAIYHMHVPWFALQV